MYKVLIIEDDRIFANMISMYLSEEGYEVFSAETAESGLAQLEEVAPHIVLLDLMLPDMDGAQVCKLIRSKSDIPILVVSMKTEIWDRVNTLQAGADDYICKPFSMRELTARIEVWIRRTQNKTFTFKPMNANTVEAEWKPQAKSLEVDFLKRTVYANGMHVETTFSEFELLKLLYTNQGMVYSREDLINALRGFDSYVNDRAIDVHIANLRKKIELDPKEPKYIKTIWGVGYKFQEN